MGDRCRTRSSEKMKQSSLKDYFTSPSNLLKDYKIVSNEWMSKKKPNSSPGECGRSKLKSKSIKKSSKPMKQLKDYYKVQADEKTLAKDKKHWEDLQQLSQIDAGSSESIKPSSKKSERKLNLVRTESFEKYGLVLPSVDRIIENIERAKIEAKALEDYENLCKNSEISVPKSLGQIIDENNPSSGSETRILLDCKYLSKEELKKNFDNCLDTLKDIKNGVVNSKRHEIYQNLKLRTKLSYNNSTVVFEEKQREYLLQLLEDVFDPDAEITEYLFMVLLPELCLRIFMTAHNMTNEEAVNYLDWRPID